MTRFNFKEACLLDASGELSPAARRQLAAYLAENPDARHEYLEICNQFQVLHSLPTVTLSPAERTAIPAHLKSELQKVFERQTRENKAFLRRKLIRVALAGVSGMAAAVLLMASIAGSDHQWKTREREQSARIDAAMARMVTPRDTANSSFDAAVTDVEASIRQLQTDSPTLAQLHDRNMGNLLDALISVPQDVDDFALSEPPAPLTSTNGSR